jgi:hypothetical protein
MKNLLIVILIAIVMPSFAQQELLQKKVSLSLKNQTLEQAIEELKKSTGFNFSYSSNFLPFQKLSIEIKEKSLEETLNKLFEGTNLSYQVMGNQIVISRKKGKATISGYIKDAESGEALIGAAVYDPYSFQGVVTNNYGFYSLTIPDTLDAIAVSFVGYEKVLKKVSDNNHLNFSLRSSNTLNAIEIVSEQALEESAANHAFTIPIQQAKSVPVIMGESDVLKVIQMMPGVTSGVEGLSSIIVRGGSSDQNLVLMDDIPVYNASHLFDIFSIFNPDAINHVRMIKGGFPSRYGGRLSSVMDIHLKEGNMYKFKGEGNIGLLSSRFAFEGPIVKDKGSFIVSARRSYLDYIINSRFVKTKEFEFDRASYVFYDINLKANYRISKKDRIFLSSYWGDDKASIFEEQNSMESKESFEMKNSWGNRINSFRWNRELGAKIFSNLIISHSHFRFSESYTANINASSDPFSGPFNMQVSNTTLSNIDDKGIKYMVDYFASSKHHIKFGASYNLQDFNPGRKSFEIIRNDIQELESLTNTPITAGQAIAFIEDDIKIGEKVNLNLGLHTSYFFVDGIHYPSFQPRAALHYKLSETTGLRASFSSMNQPIHQLRNSQGFIPIDLWMPVTKRVMPQLANQATFAIEQKLPFNLDGAIEGYYKDMKNLIEYKEGSNSTEMVDWQDQITTGRGWSYGAEVFLLKKVGKTKGWISYTLSWSMRQFEELNIGKPFYSPFDRRNDFKITLSHSFTKQLEISSNWVYATGNPVSIPESKYIDNWGNEILYFSARNNFRLRDSHRLDLSIIYKFKPYKSFEHSVIFSVYNVYNRANPMSVYLDTSSEKITLKQVSFLPIMPAINYSFKF